MSFTPWDFLALYFQMENFSRKPHFFRVLAVKNVLITVVLSLLPVKIFSLPEQFPESAWAHTLHFMGYDSANLC